MNEEASEVAPDVGITTPVVDVNVPAVGGEPVAPAPAEPVESGLLGATAETATPEPDAAPITEPSIYGDMQVQWPEGFDDEFKNDTVLKPYVGQDGKFNVNGAIKSLIHAQKSLGQGRVRIPGEDAPREDLLAFSEQVYGYTPVREDYKVDHDQENSSLEPDFAKALIDHAHEQMYPAGFTGDMLNYLDSVVSQTGESNDKLYAAQVEKDIGELKNTWGAAFDKKIGMAKMVIDRFGGDNGFKEYINETALKDDPQLARFLADVGERLYGEDGFHGEKDQSGMGQLTPQEADIEINNIYSDQSHPYHDKNHRNHQAASDEMTKLFMMKQGQKVNYKGV